MIFLFQKLCLGELQNSSYSDTLCILSVSIFCCWSVAISWFLERIDGPSKCNNFFIPNLELILRMRIICDPNLQWSCMKQSHWAEEENWPPSRKTRNPWGSRSWSSSGGAANNSRRLVGWVALYQCSLLLPLPLPQTLPNFDRRELMQTLRLGENVSWGPTTPGSIIPYTFLSHWLLKIAGSWLTG